MRALDGQILKKMLISGANNLYNHYPEVDALNVFPVPDGDTGMNMNLTMSSGVKEISNRNDEDVSVIIALFSRGLLMGARGNSGVITSQIFRGVAQALKEKKVIRLDDFITAFKNGAAVAYKAVVRPVEGTILTVIREAVQYLANNADEDMHIEKALDMLVLEANASLARTPELLPILKEAGVVDSGGAGLVKILEGMQSALEGSFIEKAAATSFIKAAREQPVGTPDYRVEFSLVLGPEGAKKPYVEKRFKSALASNAAGVDLKNVDDLVLVTLKTMTPGQVISFAQNYGEFKELKVVNLKEKAPEPQKATSSAAPAVLTEHAIVAVSGGAGIDEIFLELGVKEIVSGGQTMNPSTEDFVSSIRSAKAKNVYVLPNNANIVMAASQACDVLRGECNAMVIPSRTIPQGIVAASAYNPDVGPNDNFTEMKNALKTVTSGSLTYAVRDAVIDGLSVKKNDRVGFIEKKMVVCEKELMPAFYALIAAMVKDDASIVTILIGKSVSEHDAGEISDVLTARYSGIDFDVRRGDQPVYDFLIGVE